VSATAQLVDAAAEHAPVDRVLAQAARAVRLLGSVTPVDAARERARLVAALEGGRTPEPRWTYAAPRCDESLAQALEAIEAHLASDAATPVSRAYAARARELALECEIARNAGRRALGPLARARFAPVDRTAARAASALAEEWLALDPQPAAAPAVRSDDDTDPRSLVSRMRAAVGEHRLPFAVRAHAPLAPLAATGDDVILIATGRALSEEDAARTVLHEIQGHARPRARARTLPLGLFAIGTARGFDDQEGWALLLEQRASLAGARRRRQLAARHRAVEAMLDGATFADVATALFRVHAFDARDAVIASERAFRGGDGHAPGLGRERVYLESLVRVRDHLARHPDDERVLACGQVALEWIAALRPWAAT
jgi:hypothetical protein